MVSEGLGLVGILLGTRNKTNLTSFVVLLGMNVELGQYVDGFLVCAGRIRTVGTYQCLNGFICLFTVMIQLAL